MFSFLFKRSSKAVVTPSSEKQKQKQDSQHVIAEQQKAEQKNAALAQARALTEEAAAAAFILKTDFADARLAAAQRIQSRELLEKVLQAVRNTDRRVARLMQQRLDLLNIKERNETQARVLIEKAQALAGQNALLPNQLSEIDVGWKKLQDIPEPLAKEFEEKRQILQTRMDEQISLQRSVIEARNQARKINEALAASEPPDLEQADEMLRRLGSEMEIHSRASGAASLPRNLLADLAQELNQGESMLAKARQRIKALAAHEEAYADWEAQAVESLQIDTIRRASKALPALPESDRPAFEHRLNRLLERISASRQVPRNNSRPADDKELLNALSQLEQALEDGALQTAIEQEKILKSSDLKAAGWSSAQLARLAKARSELLRLQSWARWGGQVSREELIKTAEALQGQDIMPAELAKKVGSLRAFWKSMDATSGPAGKELWHRFDAACTAAYAPAAEHFQKLAEERKNSLQKAHAMVAEMESFAATELSPGSTDSIDWKKVTSYRAKMLQAWRELGPIDRKEKKQADAKFADAVRLISEPLAAQQEIEIRRREEIIGEAEKLDASDRHSMDAIRMLQQRWQEHAKALPLERKDEQRLWQQFRAACDQLFEQRKALMQQSESVQQTNLQLKQKICEMLESSSDTEQEAIQALLQEAAAQWKETGQVPRGEERVIEKRYQNAVSALNAKLADKRRASRMEQFSWMASKLALCRSAEEKAANASDKADMEIHSLQQEWAGIPVLPKEWEHALSKRFESAMAAIQSGSTEYAVLLLKNQAELKRNLLLLEILLEAESPAELAGERLKLQVGVLQTSLKSGGHSARPTHVLSSILEMPAFNDEASFERTRKLIHRMGDQGM